MSTGLVATGFLLVLMIACSAAFILGAVLAAGRAEDDFRELRSREEARTALRRLADHGDAS